MKVQAHSWASALLAQRCNVISQVGKPPLCCQVLVWQPSRRTHVLLGPGTSFAPCKQYKLMFSPQWIRPSLILVHPPTVLVCETNVYDGCTMNNMSGLPERDCLMSCSGQLHCKTVAHKHNKIFMAYGPLYRVTSLKFVAV